MARVIVNVVKNHMPETWMYDSLRDEWYNSFSLHDIFEVGVSSTPPPENVKKAIGILLEEGE